MSKGVILIAFTILGFCMGFWCKYVNLVFKWFERKVLEDEETCAGRQSTSAKDY